MRTTSRLTDIRSYNLKVLIRQQKHPLLGKLGIFFYTSLGLDSSPTSQGSDEDEEKWDGWSSPSSPDEDSDKENKEPDFIYSIDNEMEIKLQQCIDNLEILRLHMHDNQTFIAASNQANDLGRSLDQSSQSARPSMPTIERTNVGIGAGRGHWKCSIDKNRL